MKEIGTLMLLHSATLKLDIYMNIQNFYFSFPTSVIYDEGKKIHAHFTIL